MDNLEEFFTKDDDAPEAVEAAPAEPIADAEPAQVEDAAEPKAERPRGPDGKFISKGEPEAPEDGASPAPAEPQLDHAALIGERRRRQEAEQRIAEYEARLAQLQTPQMQPQPQGAPDRWEDPDGYDRWLVNQAAETARREAYDAFQYQRIETAASAYRTQVPDYAEKIGVFEQMVQQNPALLQELYRSPNPAEYAYNIAKTQLEINQHGGLDGLINARIQDALKAQAPTPAPSPAPPVPDTLADAQSARGSSAGGFQPTPLENILGMAKTQ